ncbi:MAG: antA/AntB antirepressor family protein [Clostridiales bacterium]|nr:antA/AntB antirepressor family protein [Clostridiales bacterium]
MNQLKVIENELVPLYETSTGEKVVYGTELHNALEVKSNYREWINRRISDCEAIENEDFQGVEISTASGQKQKQHIIKLDTAKEMAMLERNEKGKEVRRYFISVEKKYKHEVIETKNLSPQLQLMQGILDQLASQEAGIKQANDTSQKALETAESIKEVVGLQLQNWRKDSTTLINKIALKLGGYENIKSIREESYKALEQRINVSLNTRVVNIKKNMALNGVCKSKIDKINQLDAIEKDKKLIEAYVAIVKEMAIRYGVDVRKENT